MSQTVGQTDIIAKAMILVGSASRLASIDAPGPEAANLRSLWAIAVSSALETYPWKFARHRCWLNPESEGPAFGYRYRYRKPADFIRWLPAAYGEDDWFEGEEEGDYILTGDYHRHIHFDGGEGGGNRLPFRYIRLVTDITKWPPLFGDVMAHTLGMEHCQSVTALRTLSQMLQEWRDALIVKAQRADGLATGKRGRSRLPATSRWASARFRTDGYGPR